VYNEYTLLVAPDGSAAVTVNVVFDIVFAVIVGAASGMNAVVFDTANVRVPFVLDPYAEM
jgi:hypothetical protein